MQSINATRFATCIYIIRRILHQTSTAHQKVRIIKTQLKNQFIALHFFSFLVAVGPARSRNSPDRNIHPTRQPGASGGRGYASASPPTVSPPPLGSNAQDGAGLGKMCDECGVCLCANKTLAPPHPKKNKFLSSSRSGSKDDLSTASSSSQVLHVPKHGHVPDRSDHIYCDISLSVDARRWGKVEVVGGSTGSRLTKPGRSLRYGGTQPYTLPYHSIPNLLTCPSLSSKNFAMQPFQQVGDISLKSGFGCSSIM